jgi:hypothetical protein
VAWQQDDIGWRQMLLGWLCLEWEGVHQAFFRLLESWKTGKRWACELIKKTLGSEWLGTFGGIGMEFYTTITT